MKEGLRDEVTLIVSGGIALAEHMAKAIICGADLVAVDTPLLVALGCRVCRGRQPVLLPERPARCDIGSVEPGYAAQRMVNLMGAWHSQLIEVLGAMGIREVRRLRGEVGRAIFMEDIEKEAFGDLARVSAAQVRVMSTERRHARSSPAQRLAARSTVEREVRPAPDRYRNALGKYKIDRWPPAPPAAAASEVCPYGVHVKPEGYAFTLRPQDHLCIGPECAETRRLLRRPVPAEGARRCGATPAPTAWAIRAGRAT